MAITDSTYSTPASNVTADLLKRIGMNVDYQAMDFGTLMKRRDSSKPPAEGGWNLYCTGSPGLLCFTPATHYALLGDGSGRPNDPKMQELREAWFNTPDPTIRKKIAAQMELQAFENVPHYPLGLAYGPTAFRPDIAGTLEGFPVFWNVRRT
jgi:peptide/nickel transport system substrate-binding protein